MKVSKWLENVVFQNKTNRMDQINIVIANNTNEVIYCWPKDSYPIPHWINEKEIMKKDATDIPDVMYQFVTELYDLCRAIRIKSHMKIMNRMR